MNSKDKIPAVVHDRKTLVRMANRRGIRLGTTSQAFSNTSEAAEKTSAEHSGEISQEYSGPISEPTHGKPVEIPVEDPDKPSTDLSRKPRGLIRWIKFLPGRIKRFWLILFPILTEEQLQEKRWNRLALREGRKFGRVAADILASLGLKELQNSPDPNKPKHLKKVSWDGIWRDELFTKIVLSMRLEAKFRPAYVHFSELSRDPLYSKDRKSVV